MCRKLTAFHWKFEYACAFEHLKSRPKSSYHNSYDQSARTKKLYLIMYQSAAMPSRQLIFLPSA